MKPAPITRILETCPSQDLKFLLQNCPSETLEKLADVSTDLLAERNAITAHFVATLLGISEDFADEAA